MTNPMQTRRASLRHVAALGLGLLCAMPMLSRAMSAEELFRRVSPSVWVIRPLDAQGKSLGTGSGVVIDQGRLVTNCHVLAKAATILVKHENVTFQAVLEFPDTERDLCSIKVANFTAPAVQIAPVETLRVGQKIYTIGTPYGLEQTLSDGLVSSLRRGRSEAIEYIQISAPTSPGSSGGGLFDEQGRLVGITTSGITGTAQNLNFARPAQWILDLPERGRLALAAYKKPEVTAGVPSAPSAVAVAASGPAAGRVPYLSDSRQQAFRDFLEQPIPRAFAVSLDGHYGAAWNAGRGRSTPAELSGRALANCKKFASAECRLYMVDDQIVWHE